MRLERLVFAGWFAGCVFADVARITSVKGPLFIDELGRSRLFRGTNVVSKAFPYVPDTAVNADPKVSFNQKDVNLLATNAVTAIRLGVMWPGVEPTKGNYNQTYLDEITKIVKMCSDAGIYVLLDFHQDVFSEQFCGEGVPSFVVKLDSGPVKSAFPAPLGPPFVVDSTGIPSMIDCAKYSWHLYHLTATVGRNYQRLYSNVDGVRDAFIDYWKLVAKTLLPFKNILGYDLINEPFNGDQTNNAALLSSAYANTQNLEPFYEAVSTGIRSVDPNAIIHFESVAFIQDDVGFTKVPGGPEFGNKSVFNFHYYPSTQQNVDANTTISLRTETAKGLSCGSFLGEFEMGWGDKGEHVSEIRKTLQLADSFLLSTTGWEFKEYAAKTGTNNGFFAGDYSMRKDMAMLFSRPHAHAIAGTPISMSYSDDSKVFVLEFSFNGQTGLAGTTEIVTNFGLHFPTGVQVKVLSSSGAFVSAVSNEDPSNSKNAVLIVPDSKNMPTVGAGVVVAVFGTGSNVPQLTVPKAIVSQSVTTQKSSSALIGDWQFQKVLLSLGSFLFLI